MAIEEVGFRQPLPSTRVNEIIRGVNKATADIVTIQGPPLLSLRQTAGQSIPNGTWTDLLFQTEEIDNAGGHVPNSASYVVQVAGWYLVIGGCGFGVSSAGSRGTRVARNGLVVEGSAQLLPAVAVASTGTTVVSTSRLVLCAVGDTLTIQASQSSGGALSTVVSATDQQSTMTAFLVMRT